jgi:hypothetical protein
VTRIMKNQQTHQIEYCSVNSFKVNNGRTPNKQCYVTVMKAKPRAKLRYEITHQNCEDETQSGG